MDGLRQMKERRPLRTLNFGTQKSRPHTDCAYQARVCPLSGDRGVGKSTRGRPHAPLGFRPEHTRMPPRPYGEECFSTTAQGPPHVGVSTPQPPPRTAESTRASDDAGGEFCVDEQATREHCRRWPLHRQAPVRGRTSLTPVVHMVSEGHKSLRMPLLAPGQTRWLSHRKIGCLPRVRPPLFCGLC